MLKFVVFIENIVFIFYIVEFSINDDVFILVLYILLFEIFWELRIIKKIGRYNDEDEFFCLYFFYCIRSWL